MGKTLQTEISHLPRGMAKYRNQNKSYTQQCQRSPLTLFLAVESQPINRQTDTMIPKKLQWKYIGRTNAHWVGMLPDENPPVRFVLEKQTGEKYLIKSDLNGIKNCSCEGLESARKQAQILFNSYATSLFNSTSNEISIHKSNNQ